MTAGRGGGGGGEGGGGGGEGGRKGVHTENMVMVMCTVCV